MEINIHDEVVQPTMEPIKAFEVTSRKGYAMGFLHNNVIKIHHIGTNPGKSHPVKGIMNFLCKKFKTNKFIFQMVINDNLKKVIKGEIIRIPADAEGNPFGEELEEIHGEWIIEGK